MLGKKVSTSFIIVKKCISEAIVKNLLDQLDNLVNSREQEAYDLVQSRSEVLSTL